MEEAKKEEKRIIRAKSLRHLKRYRQVVSVFAKYGLKDFAAYIQTFRLPKPLVIPALAKETAIDLRLALQELGPTFIKAGQLLSSRSDLLPKIIIKELQKLLDEVAPVEFKAIKEQLETEYGRKIKETFAHIDEQPLASASLAQVHKAKLKSGESVALKIQRPGIHKQIATDIDILYDFAAVLQDRIGSLKAYNLTDMVAEFERNLRKEMDFELEGLNMQLIAKNLKEFDQVKIPTIYRQYTTKKILCLEFVEGFKPTEREELEKAGLNTKELAWKLLDIYSKQIYVDGFFQADPHIGNIFIKADGLIQIFDFGSVGKLDDHLRKEIISIVFHFIFKEGEQATQSLIRLGSQKPHTDFTALRNDVSSMIADYATMPKEYFSVGQGLLDLTRIAAKHNIEMPANFSLVGKSFLLLDFIAHQLCSSFDYHEYLEHLMPLLLYERLQADFSLQRTFRNLMESSTLATGFPSKINYFLDKINKDELHVVFQHEGLEKVTEGLNRAGFVIALSLVAVGLTFLAILSYLSKVVILATSLAVLALILLIYLLIRMLRSIKW